MFPFTRFDGYLKCVRLDDLTPGQFDFIKTLFAEFFSAPQHPSAKRDAAQEAGLPMDPVFHYRRFSGSADLPRGRYFTVCHSDAGDSGQTLALELLAYANQNCRGLVNVIDLAGLEDSDRDAYAQRFNHPLPRHALLIQFAPFGRHRETGDEVLASSIGPVVQIVPYSIERVAIDRTLDLRRLEVQTWLTQALNAGIEGMLLLQPKPLSNDTIVALRRDGGPSTIRVEPGPNASGRLEDILHGRGGRGFASIGQSCHTFVDVLLQLLYSGLGGSPVTHEVGAWIRRNGGEAIVYASARTDSSAIYDGDSIAEWSGFNLVDHRGTTPPPGGGEIIVFDPEYYSSLVSCTIAYADAVPGSPGSWRVSGLGQQTTEGIREGVYANWLAERNVPDKTIDAQVGRSPRIGPGREFPRRPIRVGNSTAVRAKLASGEIRMKDEVTIPADGKGTRTTRVGTLLSSLLGTERSAVGFEPSDRWFLFRMSRSGVVEIRCPICDWTAELKTIAKSDRVIVEDMSSHCGSCFFSG